MQDRLQLDVLVEAELLVGVRRWPRDDRLDAVVVDQERDQEEQRQRVRLQVRRVCPSCRKPSVSTLPPVLAGDRAAGCAASAAAAW